MAEEKLRNPEEMKMIPVLTVIKNGAILKNIFVVDKPQSPPPIYDSKSFPGAGISGNRVEGTEEILNVGRHPDCNIVLTHPSISRFHLLIYSNPSLQKLSVVDLSSVHGTWISGNRIDPGVLMELREGDTIKIGASTRVYSLHWIPLCRAYDTENPFISPLDVQMTGEKDDKEEEEDNVEGRKDKLLFHLQDANSLPLENEDAYILSTEGSEDDDSGDANSLPLENEDAFESNILSTEGSEDDDSGNETSVPFESEEDDEEESLPLVEKVEKTCQVTSLTYEDSNSLDITLEGLEAFVHEDTETRKKKLISSSPLIPETMSYYSIFDREEEDIELSNVLSPGIGTNGDKGSLSVEGIMCKISPQEGHNDNQIAQFTEGPIDKYIIETESKITMFDLDPSLSVNEVGSHLAAPKAAQTPTALSEDIAFPVGEVLLEAKSEHADKENQPGESPFQLQPLLGRGNHGSPTAYTKSNLLAELNSADYSKDDYHTQVLEEAGNQNILSAEGLELNSATPATEAVNEVEYHLASEVPKAAQIRTALSEDIAFPVGEVLLEAKSEPADKENQAGESPFQLQPLLGRGNHGSPTAYKKSNLLAELNSADYSKYDYHTQVLEEAGNQNILSAEGLELNSATPATKAVNEVESHLAAEVPKVAETPTALSEDIALPVGEVLLEAKSEHADKENQAGQSPFQLQPLLGRGNHGSLTAYKKSNLLAELNSADYSKDDYHTQVLEEAGNQNISSAEGLELNSATPATEAVKTSLSSAKPFSVNEAGNQNILSKGLEPNSATLATEAVKTSLSSTKPSSVVTYNEESQNPQTTSVIAGFHEVENVESSTRLEKTSSSNSIWFRRGKSATVEIQASQSYEPFVDAVIENKVELQNMEDESKRTLEAQSFSSEEIEDEICTPVIIPQILLLESLKEKNTIVVDKESELKDVLSSNVVEESNNGFDFNKENRTPKVKENKVELEDMEVESKRPRSFSSEEMEEEICTPKKENFAPQVLLPESLKDASEVVKEFQSGKSTSSSKVVISLDIADENNSIYSNKENQTPKVFQQQKLANGTTANEEQKILAMKRELGRVPFQPLTGNSSGKSGAAPPVFAGATSNRKFLNYTETVEKVTPTNLNNLAGESKRRWIMVADTASLLDKRSRKSLLLLQGLKGTRLIIPRIVIRELDDCLKRCSIFRRTEASTALKWIEECVVKTKWWIHVESSVEEESKVAPTLATSESLMEILSPSAEDRILDCALRFRKTENDGQLVLLSNDITLKVKLIAEGISCETAEEFQASLANPFSARFLWPKSTPRGKTWSVADDVVLMERYSRGLLKKSFKGLKLILFYDLIAQMS